mmetsp:Transcript_9106/g.37557  ORF Transcript_9106/g.37557 Transcript_9106/m.37557 type:complete len:201 (-) Transcript_9106:1153-1755(-)
MPANLTAWLAKFANTLRKSAVQERSSSSTAMRSRRMGGSSSSSNVAVTSVAMASANSRRKEYSRWRNGSSRKVLQGATCSSTACARSLGGDEDAKTLRRQSAASALLCSRQSSNSWRASATSCLTSPSVAFDRSDVMITWWSVWGSEGDVVGHEVTVCSVSPAVECPTWALIQATHAPSCPLSSSFTTARSFSCTVTAAS